MTKPKCRKTVPVVSPLAGDTASEGSNSPSSFDRLKTGSQSSPTRLLKYYGEQVKREGSFGFQVNVVAEFISACG